MCRLLESRGWTLDHVRGSHHVYTHPDAPRPTAQQDPWHYSIARMVDACTSAGILPFYGPYGDIGDVEGCETQFRAAFLLGCVGAWSLHPLRPVRARQPDRADARSGQRRRFGYRGRPSPR